MAVTGVVVTPQSGTIASGETLQLQATIIPSNADNQTVSWSSNNPGIATVNQNTGLVTGVSDGVTTIRVTTADGNHPAYAQITVSSPGPVTGVEIFPENGIIGIGTTLQLQAIISPSNAANQTVSWSSDNPAIATVDQSTGLVTGVSDGFATIQVTTEDGNYSAYAQIEVSSSFVAVTGVSITGSSTVQVGGSLTLTAAVEPENASNRSVSWSSDDPAVATVDKSTGLVTGVSDGFATIRVTTEDGNYSDSVQIEASSSGPVTGVTISPENGKIGIGATLELQAIISPSNTANKTVSWYSENPGVATVDSNTGLVTGISGGSVQIRVTTADGNYSAYAQIEVSSSFVAVTGVSITGSSTVQAGAFLPLTAAVKPENASNNSVIWSSNDPAVATVNEATGLVKGIAQGAAVITATTAEGQKTAQTTITVTPAAQKSFRFDMSGAKAIYAVDTSDTGSRALARAVTGESADVLVKALADDTVVPLADFSAVKEAMGDNLPLVSFMAHSPIEGSKDIYISFERDLYYREIVETSENWSDGFEQVSNGDSYYFAKYETTVIGSFIHIKADGSYTTIIKSESGNYWENNGVFKNSDDEPVLFDTAGNMYYMRSESKGTVIYRYNRGSGTVSPVTPMGGYSYTKVAISADGAYIYAQGNRWGETSAASFLRIIPTANPDIAENIYYSSGGSSSINSFTLNPQTKELYISGSDIKPGGSTVTYNGFFKGKIQSTNPNHWEWTPLVNANYENFCYPYSSSGPIIVESSKSIDSYTDEDGVWHDSDTEYTYAWNQRYRKDNGTVDYAAIMDLFYQAAVSDNIEFRYGGKTDREALASLDDAKLEDLYKRYSYDHTTGQTINDGDVQFAHDYLFRIDTGKPVVLSRSSYSFSYVTNTVFTGDGSIWGFIRDSSWYSQKYCKLIDAGGKRDFVVPESLASGRKIISIKPADPFVYYMADVNPDGSESGYQRIYRFRMDNPHTADDMFRYIYSRNPDRIEILSYAAGGDYLYFSGTQGTYILNAKIDVNSGIYTELDFGFKVSSVLAY